MTKKVTRTSQCKKISKLSKIVKKEDHLSVSKQKNVNNNVQSMSYTKKSMNKKLSPAETIGHDDYLMSQIIRMIPNSNERENLRLVSKRINFLCNSKVNNQPFQNFSNIKDSDKFKWDVFVQRNVQTFIEFSGDTLAIKVPFCNPIVLKYLENRREMIEFQRHRIKKIEIESIHDDCLNFLRSLNCFESVEMITFHPINASSLVLKVFEYCSSLKPHTIRFAWLYMNRINFHPITFERFQTNKLFPKSVKTIKIDCNPHAINWLFKATERISNRFFETLIIGNELYSGLIVLETREKILKLMKCFQNIKINLSEQLEYDVTSNLAESLSLVEVDSETKLSYDVMITLHKFRYNRFDPLTDELIPEDIDIRVAILNILNLRHFRVQCHPSWTKPSKYYINPFPKLLKMMRNLTTLELSMRIFHSPNEFKTLVTKLNINIKNVKLSHCEKLNNTCIESLANSCKEITYLSLEHVKSNSISIKKAISFFQNLKGFSVFFLHHSRNINSFNDFLVKKKDRDNVVTLNWPELDFLQVVFNAPITRDKKFLEQIEKETPRQCGRFIIKYHSKKRFSSSEVVEIIIQKSTKYYSQFIKLFSKPSWIND
uniref:F-box domain-containing protein n=1 Tax=Strongyloides stercoralis TaxID=6248 RepID=A0A0K0EDY4_STRER